MSSHILNHHPILSPAEDKLHRGPVATLLLEKIDKLSGEGGTIGLLGSHGTGKTSVRTLLEGLLSGREKGSYVILPVMAWKFPTVDIAQHLTIEAARVWKSTKSDLHPLTEDLHPERLTTTLFDQWAVTKPAETLAAIHPGRAKDLNAVTPGYLKRGLLFAASLAALAMIAAGAALVATLPAPDKGVGLGAVGILLFLIFIKPWLDAVTSLVKDRAAAGLARLDPGPVVINMAEAGKRDPGAAAAKLGELATFCREKTGKNLVVWVEDVDRCDPELARRLLGLLRTAFLAPGIVFVVECDDRALARSLEAQRGVAGNDADSIMQKVFSHSIPIPLPSPDLVSELLKEQGGKILELSEVVLDIVRAGIGPNPRRIKRAPCSSAANVGKPRQWSGMTRQEMSRAVSTPGSRMVS